MAAPIAFVRDTVERLRRDRSAWAECAYRPGHDAAGEQIDLGAKPRAAALVGLSYDLRDDDIELCRYLLEQEVLDAEGSDLQGFDDSLRRACFLVARAKDPQDIWMLCRAKLANYDTFCGLDREYLYAAGLTRIVDYVKASAHPDRARVLEELLDKDGAPWFTDEELASWWQFVTGYFPADPNDDTPLSVAQTALYFGTPAEALPWLEKWAAGPREPRERKWAVDIATEIAGDETLRGCLVALMI